MHFSLTVQVKGPFRRPLYLCRVPKKGGTFIVHNFTLAPAYDTDILSLLLLFRHNCCFGEVCAGQLNPK